MIDLVIKESKLLDCQYEIIDVLYPLSSFKSKRIDQLIQDFCQHKDYLVTYNATTIMGLSTKKVVKKFRKG